MRTSSGSVRTYLSYSWFVPGPLSQHSEPEENGGVMFACAFLLDCIQLGEVKDLEGLSAVLSGLQDAIERERVAALPAVRQLALFESDSIQ